MKNKFLLEQAHELLVNPHPKPALAKILLLYYLTSNQGGNEAVISPFAIATKKIKKFRTDCVQMRNDEKVAVGVSEDKIIISKGEYVKIDGVKAKSVLVDNGKKVQKGDFPNYETSPFFKSEKSPLKLIDTESLEMEYRYTKAQIDAGLSDVWYMPICLKTDKQPQIIVSLENVPYIIKAGSEGWSMPVTENGIPGTIVKKFDDGSIMVIATVVKNES